MVVVWGPAPGPEIMAEDGDGVAALEETVIAAIEVVGTEVLGVVVVVLEVVVGSVADDDNFIEVGGISAFKFGIIVALPLPSRFFFTFLAWGVTQGSPGLTKSLGW